jgi:hypothetical protein
MFSCNESNNLEVLRSPEIFTPRVNGIVVTDEYGEIYSLWGDPQYPESPKLYLGDPYPNPTHLSIGIHYQIEEETLIKLWVSPASWLGEISQNNVQILNSNYLVAGGLAVKELLSRKLKVGKYHYQWDCRDNDGNLVKNGFYRIYLQNNDDLIWKDIPETMTILTIIRVV